MNLRFLVPLAWSLLGAVVILLLYGLVRVFTDRSTSPEAGRGLGVMVIVGLLVVVGIAGVLLNIAIRRQSVTGVMTMAVLLGWPVLLLVASPLVRAYKAKSFENEYARSGDFTDPVLASLAQAISAADTAALTRLLDGKAPPRGKDKAGNDLLAFALVHARDRRGNAAPVRLLLQSGADPRQTSIGTTGQDALNFMLLGMNDVGKEVVRLLLDHGVDVNARDPETGDTPLGTVSDDPEVVRWLVERGADVDALQSSGLPPVVGFIGKREWESALVVIEKGANLDQKNADGLSVDYYLNDWKVSVFGDHPEGWDRVRAAIAARRGKGT